MVNTIIAGSNLSLGNHMASAKVVHLENNLVIAALISGSNVEIYKSANNGITWGKIKTITSTNASYLSVALVNIDRNEVGIFINTTLQSITFIKLNVFTLAETETIVDSAQFQISSMVVTKDITTGHLHAVWLAKNTSISSNVFNIRYAKSTDEGVTWTAPVQATSHTRTDHHIFNIDIVAHNGYPTILYVFQNNAVGEYQVISLYQILESPGPGFNLRNVTNSNATVLAHLSACVDQNGRIHAAFTRGSGIQYSTLATPYMSWTSAKDVDAGGSPTIQTDITGAVRIGYISNAYKLKIATTLNNWDFVLEDTELNVRDVRLLQADYLKDVSEVPAIFTDTNGAKFRGVFTNSNNSAPTINITSPVANQTFHENGILTMAGSTVDTDADDVVTIKYQIDSGTVRNLHSAVSDGSTPIDFSKSLTYKDGVLKDGATTVTSTLDKDVPHTVSMWAEDGKGGKSNIITRSFFVVPNRAPQVTISPITQQSALINSEVINVSGAVIDLDNNDVTVTFSINSGEEQQVYQGPPSAFTFNILLANLKTGANTVIVKATDTYNMSSTKTLNINKTHDAVPVNTAVARYQIVAPTGSAQSILLWVTRTLGNLGINAAVSLTNANEAENYVDLTPTNTGVVNGNREDEFAYQGTVSKEKIILKITYNRTDANVIDTIKQISGVLF